MNKTWEELAVKVETFVGMKCEPEPKFSATGQVNQVHLHFRTKNLFKLATITVFRAPDGWKIGGSRDGVQDHMMELQNLNGD